MSLKRIGMKLSQLFNELLGRIKNIFKKEYVVGLDIGSSVVKMVLFSYKENGLYLTRAEVREMEVENGISSDDEKIRAIRYLLRGVDLKKSKIVVSINCPQTAIKKITTPYMPKSELREGIKLQAKNYFPFPIDASLVDFEITGDVVEKGIRKYDVVVAASPKRTVDKNLSLLGNVGLQPISIISSSYSLYKIAQHQYGKDNKTICFVDIGDQSTELIITKGKILMFNRKIPITGSDFTKAMSGTFVSEKGKMQLSLSDAEKIKREIGIPQESGSKIIDDKITTFQILSLLRSPLEQLANEIGKCFDYCREETGSGAVYTVVISGGGASLSGLIKFLTESLGIEVHLLDPLEGLKIEKDALSDRDKISHRIGLAIGASLSGAADINLLPIEIKEKTNIVLKRSTVEFVVTVILVTSILSYIGMKIGLENLKKRIAVARVEFSTIQPQLKNAEAQAIANKVLVNEPQWEDVFTELSNIIPPPIYLESLSMENDIINLKGIVSSSDGEQILADFILTLEKGIFNNVKLVESKNLGEGKGVEFTLKCWLDYAN